jgi:hypothetical protein
VIGNRKTSSGSAKTSGGSAKTSGGSVKTTMLDKVKTARIESNKGFRPRDSVKVRILSFAIILC